VKLLEIASKTLVDEDDTGRLKLDIPIWRQQVPATSAPLILDFLARTLDADSQVLAYKNPTIRRLWQI
jgi:hypothetical protein